MYLAVDDTDSREGMCTTYLLARMMAEMPFDLIGLPRLVRLNPAVPWKTRGNAALTMRVGVGGGNVRKAGEHPHGDIVVHDRLRREADADDVMDFVRSMVERHRHPDSDPGIVVSRTKPPQRLYWSGARDILEQDNVVRILDESGAMHEGGRGVIGAACAMAWRPRDRSLELLSYRDESKWGTERRMSIESVARMDAAFPTTFNNIEVRWKKAAIYPSTPCPVLFGIRGDDLDELLAARGFLEGEMPERWNVLLTNQGTDDHIIDDANELLPDRSYRLLLKVTSMPKEHRGGHVIIRASLGNEEIDCAAYEPSKEFRDVVRALRPGDEVSAYGELRDKPRTLNLEKIQVLTTSVRKVKEGNPRCPKCGKAMKSIGSNAGYRCRRCSVHVPEEAAPTAEEVRTLIPGWYEPPVCARRHISKPLCRMGLCQPIDFV